nr:carbohydrate sulfotransferase 11-like [Penaeus vannamei]
MAIQVLQLPADRNYISFSEFLVHVISTRRHADRHWSTYRQLCSPCYFHYDYIALLETYTEDMQYLAQELGIPIDPEARRNAKSVPGEDESAAAFRFDIFKEDMEMFDYKLPDDFWLSDDDEVSLVS